MVLWAVLSPPVTRGPPAAWLLFSPTLLCRLMRLRRRDARLVAGRPRFGTFCASAISNAQCPVCLKETMWCLFPASKRSPRAVKTLPTTNPIAEHVPSTLAVMLLSRHHGRGSAGQKDQPGLVLAECLRAGTACFLTHHLHPTYGHQCVLYDTACGAGDGGKHHTAADRHVL